MEIKMILCPKCGEVYNASIHPSCPRCAQGVDVTQPARGEAFGSTIPVDAGAAGTIGGTQPVNSNRGEVVGQFQPTVLGGGLAAAGQAEPVVGWLACVEGPMRGTDYRVHAGYNYIGREVGDIHIHGDQQISRENHAMIAYDSSEQIYYVGPSAGRNLIKVNGKAVLNAVEVKSYDVISIGTTKLMFVALCGPHFSWNEGGSNE